MTFIRVNDEIDTRNRIQGPRVEVFSSALATRTRDDVSPETIRRFDVISSWYALRGTVAAFIGGFVLDPSAYRRAEAE